MPSAIKLGHKACIEIATDLETLAEAFEKENRVVEHKSVKSVVSDILFDLRSMAQEIRETAEKEYA